MSFRPTFPILLALAALLFAAGCERSESQMYTAEVDEPGFRRGKELLRQGRSGEALSEFERVLAKRGLNNAPETHLELALLYQQHINDPIFAIYHFRKFSVLKSNSEQAELVRQRIEAAKREFARTLPGRPSIDTSNAPYDLQERLNKLQTDNSRLQAALKAALAGMPDGTFRAQQQSPQQAQPAQQAQAQPPRQQQPQQPAPIATAAVAQARPAQTAPAAAQTAQPQQPPQPIAAVRRHVVKPSETLYGIARQYYGTVTRAQIDAIVNANRNVLQRDTDPLRIGMELRIP